MQNPQKQDNNLLALGLFTCYYKLLLNADLIFLLLLLFLSNSYFINPFSHFTTVIFLKKERREVIKKFGRLIVGSFIGWKLKFNLIMCHLFQVSSLKSKRFSCKG